jgi:tetratricopeptide (TPR) repeat protein
MSKPVKRLTPTRETIRKLLLRSGNECAFPGCAEVLFNDRDTLIAECCHIEAALPGGERYNPNQSDEDCRSYDNLLFLCHKHHVETDDVTIFSVEALKKIKIDHDNRFREKQIVIGGNYVEQVTNSFQEIFTAIRDTSERVKHIDENLSELLKAQAQFEKEKIQYKEYFGPPQIAQFKGRIKELGALHIAFEQFNTFMIGGVSGVGKSTLIAQFLVENKTHKALWIDCEIVNNKEAFYEYFARFIRQEFNDNSIIQVLSATDNDVIQRSIINSLQQNHCCIVFDGLDDRIAELNPLLKSLNEYLISSKLFISTKFNIETVNWRNAVYKEALSGLDLEAFISLSKSYGIDTVSIDDQTNLYNQLNGHPFLLKLSISVLQYQPIESFISQLTSQNSIEISEYIKQKALEILSHEELILLEKLSVFVIPFRYKIGEYISPQNFPSAFKGLKDNFLIESFHPGFFIIPEFVRSHVVSPENRIDDIDLYKSYVEYLKAIENNLRNFERNALIFHAIKANMVDVARDEATKFLSGLMDNGKFNLAYRLALELEDGVETNQWSFIYYVQGRVNRFQGDYEQALKKYNQGLGLNDSPKSIATFKFERASILTYLAKELNEPKLLEEAKTSYIELSVTEDPTLSLQCQLSLLSIQLRSKNQGGVINKLEQLTNTINTEKVLINVQAGLWQMLGDAYSKAKEYPKAFQSFDKSIDLYKEAIVIFGMNTVDGLYHLYESYGWTYANAGDYSGAAQLFGLCVGLCNLFDLGLTKEKALFDYGFHLIMDKEFDKAVEVLREHYSFIVGNDLIEETDMPFVHGTLSFAQWYSGDYLEAVELLGLYILSSYKRGTRPVISIIEEDGMSDSFDVLNFFEKRMYVFIIPSGKTHQTFNEWVNVVAERREELKEPLSQFTLFKGGDGPESRP